MSAPNYSRHGRLLIQGLISVIAVLWGQMLLAQNSHVALSQDIVNATKSFMASLSASQRQKATYDFADAERLNWHFIPRDRNGVVLKGLLCKCPVLNFLSMGGPPDPKHCSPKSIISGRSRSAVKPIALIGV